jgi:hypothetical protein
MRTNPSALAVCLTLLCCQQAPAQSGPRAPGTRKPEPLKVVEHIYEAGFQSGWQDYGWAPRDLQPGQSAHLDFSNKGGWIIARPGLKGRFGGLVFRFRAPTEYGDFLEVRVDSANADVFPRVAIGPAQRIDAPDGWSQAWVPIEALNPSSASFDRIVLRAARRVGSEKVDVDDIGFTEGSTGSARVYLNVKEAAMRVDCLGDSHPIKPAIYGIALSVLHEARDLHQWQLGAAARRWGGNVSTRYNWQIGTAWNTASDWFFRNVNYSGQPHYTYRTFLDDDLTKGVQSALTLPIMGWVAKDMESASFPVSAFGPQRNVDSSRSGDVGDGYTKDGKPIPPGAPERTSVATSPEGVGRWVSAIKQEDATRHLRSVQMYILDNEPMLWNSTHRDVHPQATSYDELLDRTLTYAAAVRRADPEAVIAGPAEWGWPAYFYSAVDSAAGVTLHPDRRAHGNVPLLEWYLRELKTHEDKTGERLLDVVDVHFYPQGKGIGINMQGGTDPATSARRLRATRSLWDPTYVDESWIGEPIELIPRLKRMIQANYPGRGISIGEYNFGAEGHISGGLALAQALGIFGQQGIDAAFYWTYPDKDTPAFWAFRAYRNFDGKGGRFLDLSVPTSAPEGSSLYASKDAAGGHVVLVVLNTEPTTALRASIDLTQCGPVKAERVFTHTADAPSLVEGTAGARERGAVVQVLPPFSFSVLDITFDKKGR